MREGACWPHMQAWKCIHPYKPIYVQIRVYGLYQCTVHGTYAYMAMGIYVYITYLKTTHRHTTHMSHRNIHTSCTGRHTQAHQHTQYAFTAPHLWAGPNHCVGSHHISAPQPTTHHMDLRRCSRPAGRGSHNHVSPAGLAEQPRAELLCCAQRTCGDQGPLRAEVLCCAPGNCCAEVLCCAVRSCCAEVLCCAVRSCGTCCCAEVLRCSEGASSSADGVSACVVVATAAGVLCY